MGNLTPMMRQYLEIKKLHQDAILFYLMGDFYEMFYEDALTASKVLGIALTTRDEGREKKHCNGEGLRSTLRWLGQTLAKLIRIGNENFLVVSRKGQELFSLPVTVCAVLLMCSVGTVLFALAIGLFCGLRYSFEGA